MTRQVSFGHFWSYCLEIRSHISKGKGQQVMEHNWFSLELQVPDGKVELGKQVNQACHE